MVGQADFSSPPDRLSCKVWETFVNSGLLFPEIGYQRADDSCHEKRESLFKCLCKFSYVGYISETFYRFPNNTLWVLSDYISLWVLSDYILLLTSYPHDRSENNTLYTV